MSTALKAKKIYAQTRLSTPSFLQPPFFFPGKWLSMSGNLMFGAGYTDTLKEAVAFLSWSVKSNTTPSHAPKRYVGDVPSLPAPINRSFIRVTRSHPITRYKHSIGWGSLRRRGAVLMTTAAYAGLPSLATANGQQLYCSQTKLIQQ